MATIILIIASIFFGINVSLIVGIVSDYIEMGRAGVGILAATSAIFFLTIMTYITEYLVH